MHPLSYSTSLLTLLLVVSTARAQSTEIDELISGIEQPDGPGCALLVLRNGETIYQREFGLADLEHRVPITSQTVFNVASLAKQFTAAVIALLAEDGRLSLDGSVRAYLPELPAYFDSVTLRHLIHHTSGVREYMHLVALTGLQDHESMTSVEVLNLIARQNSLNSPPGERHVYSNSGYFLLAQLAERVTGRSFHELTQHMIFESLGMSRTRFLDDWGLIIEDRAIGHTRNDDGEYRIWKTNFDLVGSGGLMTTVEDLALWDHNYYDNSLGRRGAELMKQLTTPGVLNDGTELLYAFGLNVGENLGLKVNDHSGFAVGYESIMLRYPEHKLTVICLGNAFGIGAQRLARQVVEICLADAIHREEEKSPPPIEEVQVTAQESRAIEGTYFEPNYPSVRYMSIRDGQLLYRWIGAAEGEGIRLDSIGDGRFRCVRNDFILDLSFSSLQDDLYQIMTYKYGDNPPIRFNRVSPLPDSVLEMKRELAGIYYSEELDRKYTISLVEDNLTLHMPGWEEEYSLEPAFEDAFFYLPHNFLLRFERDEEGQVRGFIFDSGSKVKGVRFIATQQP